MADATLRLRSRIRCATLTPPLAPAVSPSYVAEEWIHWAAHVTLPERGRRSSSALECDKQAKRFSHTEVNPPEPLIYLRQLANLFLSGKGQDVPVLLSRQAEPSRGEARGSPKKTRVQHPKGKDGENRTGMKGTQGDWMGRVRERQPRERRRSPSSIVKLLIYALG